MAKAALSALDKSAKAANIASVIGTAGDISALAINVISTISDQKKRAFFEQNLALLSADQKKKLDQLLIDARSEAERLKIITDALSASNVQRINNIATMYAQAEKKKRNQQILVVGGFLVFAAIAITLTLKKS